ncbi:hypothetical protein GUITHDRAFT_110105 [Guillardia theta CCMP2712]|uniref:Uncharacterized protein n=2 Tax=Guillardia theta TaxID=55529 RepID=L1J7C1_GUITC|nr:hypothetical protein GUITHDRAFT_110105 [Guillardia theta CCMP2712]EKX43999.1 hypothetical protein GUITHDRAFT_110105 [Guillardia theta CCMP2712]|eukprot:XP_005830979.1 hypothetical protein GUITHDRAFT_110105 [Guillardia theta CCMP2712]
MVAGLACMASCLFLVIFCSHHSHQARLLMQSLKLFKVEVKAPPSCCGSTPASYSSSPSSSVQMTDGGTQQINMVGFTDKGMGYIQYRGWGHGEEGDEEGRKKTHRVNLARLRHEQHRQVSKEQVDKINSLKRRVSKDDGEITSLKGELWTLSSSILPRIEEEVSELRKQVKQIKRK